MKHKFHAGIEPVVRKVVRKTPDVFSRFGSGGQRPEPPPYAFFVLLGKPHTPVREVHRKDRGLYRALLFGFTHRETFLAALMKRPAPGG